METQPVLKDYIFVPLGKIVPLKPVSQEPEHKDHLLIKTTFIFYFMLFILFVCILPGLPIQQQLVFNRGM